MIKFTQVLFFKNNQKINSFTICGERHSGTNWLENLLKIRCGLNLTWGYGYKHWINDINWNVYKRKECESTLFLCITRNIFDWIPAFFLQPHHVRSEIIGDFNLFINSQWNKDYKELNFITQKPYHNIFELRKQKLEYYYYFLPLLVSNIVIITYEELLSDTKGFLSFLKNEFDIKVIDNQPNSFIDPHVKTKYKLTSNQKQNIVNLTDWQTENLYGYSKHMI